MLNIYSKIYYIQFLQKTFLIMYKIKIMLKLIYFYENYAENSSISSLPPVQLSKFC